MQYLKSEITHFKNPQSVLTTLEQNLYSIQFTKKNNCGKVLPHFLLLKDILMIKLLEDILTQNHLFL